MVSTIMFVSKSPIYDQYILLKIGADLVTNFMRQKKGQVTNQTRQIKQRAYERQQPACGPSPPNQTRHGFGVSFVCQIESL